MASYHVNPQTGKAARCTATKRACPFGGKEEHYPSLSAALESYELTQARSLQAALQGRAQGDTQGVTYTLGRYDFNASVEDYGIGFIEPRMPGVYYEENTDGSVFFRFEETDDLFEEYRASDVRAGYALKGVELKTLQYYISPEVVESYRKARNPFSSSRFRYDKEDERESFPMVAIIGGEPYIIDGNHRFAAAKANGLSAFAAVVVEFSSNGSEFYDVSPEEFNARFARKLVSAA